MAAERKRIDVLLAEKGFFPSRSAARAAVMAGLVYVNGQKIEKPGTQVATDAALEVKELPRYVSRGGLKLEKALREFAIDLTGKTAIDVGASTGGFTDCMLQHGAQKVYSIDVGYGQLDWRLRQDERVVLLERTNIRYLSPEAIKDPVEFAAIDVSFISLALVLPVIQKLGVPEIVTLVKPQFEIGKDRVGKKGVVKKPEDHYEVLQNITAKAAELGYAVINATYSPIRGPQGNIEYLLHLRQKPSTPGKEIDYTQIVALAHQNLSEKGDLP
ncbi:MAG: TlyA family RNA methyltransferase [Firmicutes bacterium]|nr:TlyA family RNA methyltransferase [Bacillota bacterium]